MFQNQRFVTNGVCSELDGYSQLLLWNMVDGLQVPKDYLQVFRITPFNLNGVLCQKITHTQEQPAYKNEVIIPVSNPVNLKLYCIDNGEYSTLLLVDEY